MVLFFVALRVVLALGLPPPAVFDIYAVALGTGEDPRILGVVMWEESKGNVGAVGYCAKWERVNGLLTCRKAAVCKSGCSRPEVWNNRMDLGQWQIRCVTPRVGKDGVRGYSRCASLRRLGWDIQDSDMLDRYVSRRVMIYVVNEMKKHPPQCKYRRGEADWLSWYACGRKGCGCKVRQYRLKQSEKIK